MILEIKNLNLYFKMEDNQKKIHALININLNVPQGKIIGVAGESGCGKTLTSLTLMNLLPDNAIFNAEVSF